ncbi:hypothetical protein N7463_003422 [Penicillium fimorum]|uniref:Uncharacterized protein n=1 Tax=Penicillium fimorum TaxID=1882269 RepID=A0A9W9Y2E9_9EURO|nr:hypothetical protein N7463_003422 [Penicillium fimorum]
MTKSILFIWTMVKSILSTEEDRSETKIHERQSGPGIESRSVYFVQMTGLAPVITPPGQGVPRSLILEVA